MGKTANHTGWGTEKAKHKEQELNLEEESTVKDLILKKYLWLYKFEDIFYKHLTISPSILIESEQLVCRHGMRVNNSELRGFNFDLGETSKAHGEIKITELGLLLDNYDNNNNSDPDFYFDFFKLHKINNKIRFKNNKQM